MNKSFYIYGDIVSDNTGSWFCDPSETAVTPKDLQEEIDELSDQDVLDIYINSNGGEVFAATAMTAMLKRAKDKGIKVNTYVDGIAASSASLIAMAGDTITVYDSSMIMIHKPISYTIGNSEDMLKSAETLENVENATMIPLYMTKALVDEEEIKALVTAETWMGVQKIQQYFNVTHVTESKQPVAVDKKYFGIYKNIPESLKNITNKKPEEAEKVDYTDLYKQIAKL